VNTEKTDDELTTALCYDVSKNFSFALKMFIHIEIPIFDHLYNTFVGGGGGGHAFQT
jgi:hypothetical protein